jgi:hypothetical protein
MGIIHVVIYIHTIVYFPSFLTLDEQEVSLTFHIAFFQGDINIPLLFCR